MKRRLVVTVVAGFAAVTMAACSGGSTSGTPSSTGSASGSGEPSSGVSSALPYAGAPKVANPLPASALSGDPCTDALTAQQVTDALGSPVKTKQDTLAGFGPSCSWTSTDTTSSAQITVTYDTTTHQGLSGAYQNSKPRSKIWREMSIEGFPAVAHASAHNSCQIFVGLADDVMIDVGGFLSLSKIGQVDPCQSTQKAASAVVTTLKQKAGA